MDKKYILLTQISHFFRLFIIISAVTIIFAYFLLKHEPNFILFGLLISVSVSILIFLYNSLIMPKVKSLSFLLSLMISTFYYLFVIITVSTFSIIFLNVHKNYSSVNDVISIWSSGKFISGMGFGLILSFVMNFIMMINLLLGKNVLIKLILGRYHKPREEKKVFMFLDIKSSTGIAEKIGHMKFLSLVNDFFTDAANAIIEAKAEIYKYVGDEAILVWDYNRVSNGEPLNCFFNIEKIIDKKSEIYLKNYGLKPEFKASLHCGEVICGEIGLFKKEISYMGDVLNTASRIESLCSSKNKKFLISGDVLKIMKTPDNLTALNLGKIELRDKKNYIEIYVVNKN